MIKLPFFIACFALGAIALCSEQSATVESEPSTTLEFSVVLENTRTITLTRDRGSDLLIAHCTVNGIPCPMIVDTGATNTTLDTQFVQKHLPGVPLHNIQIHPDSNVQKQPKLLFAESLRVGGLHIKNDMILTTDLKPLQETMDTPIAGILGLSSLLHCPFRLSVKNATLTFVLPEQLEHLQAVELPCFQDPDSPLFFLLCEAVHKAAKPFMALLDSGASCSFAPRGYWPDNPNSQMLINQITDINGTQEAVEIEPGAPAFVIIGNRIQLPPVSFALYPPGENEQAIIGTTLLQYFDVLLDVKQGKIWALQPEQNTDKPQPTP